MFVPILMSRSQRQLGAGARLLSAVCLLSGSIRAAGPPEPGPLPPAAPPPAAALPDPLVAADGTRITTPALWWSKRRPELLETFTRDMYGRAPGKAAALTVEVFDREPKALDGTATRIQLAIRPVGAAGPRLDLLVYVPNRVSGSVPAILGLNFLGNHTIHPDPAIRLTESWVDHKPQLQSQVGNTDNRASEASRGCDARQWPVAEILARGYAVATMYREDVAADHPPYFASGVHPLFPELQQADDNFGTVAAWAWALSRALDALENEPSVDAKRVAAFGFSRLGKAALWAGACDQRFAMVLSNESGAGGAKLFHRGVGEDIKRLNTVFPHWFARNFRQFIGRDTALPFDQHQVIALIAPRPVYVASASGDKNSDPEGEFAATKAAEPVYLLLGAQGLPCAAWPAIGTSVQGGLGYHVRAGRHDLLPFDWQQYLTFADRHLKR